MRNSLLGSIGGLLAGAGLALAQWSSPPAKGDVAPVMPVQESPLTAMKSKIDMLTSKVSGPITRVDTKVEAPPAPPVVVQPRGMVQSHGGQVIVPSPGSYAPPSECSACAMPGGPCCLDDEDCYDECPWSWKNRSWVSAEYLLWWIKDFPIPQPLVTTSADLGAIAGFPGILGQPGTIILAGAEDLVYQPFSGLRLGGGFVLNDRKTWAIESSIFWLAERTLHSEFQSGPTGIPSLSRPFFRPETQDENVFLVSFPDAFSGGVKIEASSELWGTELNAVHNCFRYCALSLDVLFGGRYLSLEESLGITSSTRALDGGTLFFNGVAGDTGSTSAVVDTFTTENHFFGGQVGAKIEYRCDCWYIYARSKVALGATSEEVNIRGITQSTLAGGGGGSAVGGLLALPSNIGTHSTDEFSVVPEVDVTLGLNVTPTCRLYAGYNFMYWSNVARPGEQIDRTINLNAVPSSPVFGQGGPQVPRPLLTSTDFWVHGLNVGLAFRF